MKKATTTPATIEGEAFSTISKAFLLAFGLFSLANIVAESGDLQTLIYWTKPSLMVWLLLFFLLTTRGLQHPTKKWFILAIIGANAGDILLMFTEQAARGELFFLFGLSAFLITHLCYSIAFRQLASSAQRLSTPFLIGLVLFWILFNGAFWSNMPSDLRIPVLVYSAVILVMVAYARYLYQGQPTPATQLIWWGALAFLVSDSFIGLNKFGQHLIQIPYVRPLIMTTYLLGQVGIIYGASRLLRTRKKISHA